MDVKPWYRNPDEPTPFRIQTQIKPEGNDTKFSCIQPFPWDIDSVQFLWNGELLRDPANLDSWAEVIDTWSGAFVAYGDYLLTVLTRNGKAFNIELPSLDGAIVKENRICCCVWAIKANEPFEPLVLFNDSRVLHILNVNRREVVSTLVGHGGVSRVIPSVHPTAPYLFCTTSRDFTARVYDLTLTPRQTPNNPHWPPGDKPSRGGAPAGLHSSEPEGRANGIGRCIAIITGGRSGGHEAAVLNSAFHPHYPLLATCGVDRAVKIWKLPVASLGVELVREDKPLFSSSRIHQSRVLSINWLSEDILISHCAPVPLRTSTDGEERIVDYPGNLVLWRWLGLGRFFPPQFETTFRGPASDYQESASFKCLSAYSIPKHTNHISVHQSQTRKHDPIIILCLRSTLQILNVTNFSPRPKPAFPGTRATSNSHPSRAVKKRRLSLTQMDESEQVIRQIDEVPNWTLAGGNQEMITSAMGPGGRTILAIGTYRKGSTLWKWRLKDCRPTAV